MATSSVSSYGIVLLQLAGLVVALGSIFCHAAPFARTTAAQAAQGAAGHFSARLAKAPARHHIVPRFASNDFDGEDEEDYENRMQAEEMVRESVGGSDDQMLYKRGGDWQPRAPAAAQGALGALAAIAREPAAKRALSLFAHWRTPYASSEDNTNLSADMVSAVARGGSPRRPVGQLRWG